MQAEHRSGLDGAFVQKQIITVQVDGNAERLLCGRDTGDMIDVRMRQQNVTDRQPIALHE